MNKEIKFAIYTRDFMIKEYGETESGTWYDHEKKEFYEEAIQ